MGNSYSRCVWEEESMSFCLGERRRVQLHMKGRGFILNLSYPPFRLKNSLKGGYERFIYTCGQTQVSSLIASAMGVHSSHCKYTIFSDRLRKTSSFFIWFAALLVFWRDRFWGRWAESVFPPRKIAHGLYVNGVGQEEQESCTWNF